MTHSVRTVQPPTLRAVFWDIDGTLIDSEELHYHVIADWCRVRGYLLTIEDNAMLLGKSMIEKWHHLASVHDFNADSTVFSTECANMYCRALHSEMQRNETVAVFRKLAAMNIPQACVSNGDLAVVKANLKILDLQDLVQFSISGEDVKNGKPDPEPYLLAAEMLGVEPGNCLVVEDSRVGVRSAAAAGMRVVAWPEAGTSREGYEQAEYIVTDSTQFPWEFFVHQ